MSSVNNLRNKERKNQTAYSQSDIKEINRKRANGRKKEIDYSSPEEYSDEEENYENEEDYTDDNEND